MANAERYKAAGKFLESVGGRETEEKSSKWR